MSSINYSSTSSSVSSSTFDPSSSSASTATSSVQSSPLKSKTVHEVTVCEPSSEPTILPLRPNPTKENTLKMMLQKKLEDKKNFASPTDEMMSPCSQRLKEYKAKKGSRAPSALLMKTFAKKKEEQERLAAGKENKATAPPPPTEPEGEKDADDVF